MILLSQPPANAVKIMAVANPRAKHHITGYNEIPAIQRANA
jgi:hypothetical protein